MRKRVARPMSSFFKRVSKEGFVEGGRLPCQLKAYHLYVDVYLNLIYQSLHCRVEWKDLQVHLVS